MSHRELSIDIDQIRQNAYKAQDSNQIEEAIWEALTALDAAGIEIGAKAKNILAQRADIKLRAPK